MAVQKRPISSRRRRLPYQLLPPGAGSSSGWRTTCRPGWSTESNGGLGEVREGRVFCLSLPLDRPGGNVLNANRYPPVVRPTLRGGAVNYHCAMAGTVPGANDLVSDDLVVLHTQYSTQWDAFGHAGAYFDADGDGQAEPVYYNGWRAGTDAHGPSDARQAGLQSLGDVTGASEGTASTSHAGPVGVDAMAVHGVQGRAVLVDLAAHFGTERVLVGLAELEAVLAADRVVVGPGDIVVLHTGFTTALMAGEGRPTAEVVGSCPVLDGRDPGLQAWVRESGLAALAADNYAVEAFPPQRVLQDEPALPLHRLCLFELGVHLGPTHRGCFLSLVALVVVTFRDLCWFGVFRAGCRRCRPGEPDGTQVDEPGCWFRCPGCCRAYRCQGRR